VHISTLGAFLEEAEHLLMDADLYYGHGTDNAWDEAVALASYVLDLPPDVDASVMDRTLTAEEKNTLMALVERRINDKIPVPYLSHTAWFFGLAFYVDERVIIPRSPLAELIDHQFQPWLGDRLPERILDLCTGSGCIAIACAYAFENAQVDAVEVSELALQVAQKNLTKHQKEKQVNLILGDLFDGCQGPYDIIISNPPYVSEQEYQQLPEEYHYEPKLALETGDNGLAIVHRILKEAPNYLTPKGILIVEVGNSADALIAAYPDIPFTWLNFERGGDGVFLLELGENKRWKS
jgi:ribosomal protein L3 glutamine methyltransferase